MSESTLSPSAVAEQITYVLLESGARLISRSYYNSWPDRACAYEDEFAVVAIWPYDSFSELADQWLVAQDAMARLVSTNIVSPDPKAWDGYLILCTSDRVPVHLAAELNSIRADTRRLRKLVVTGDDLRDELTDLGTQVRRAIAPVVRLRIDVADAHTDPLATITDRLLGTEEFKEDLQTVLNAYARGESTVPALHNAIAVETERTMP